MSLSYWETKNTDYTAVDALHDLTWIIDEVRFVLFFLVVTGVCHLAVILFCNFNLKLGDKYDAYLHML